MKKSCWQSTMELLLEDAAKDWVTNHPEEVAAWTESQIQWSMKVQINKQKKKVSHLDSVAEFRCETFSFFTLLTRLSTDTRQQFFVLFQYWRNAVPYTSLIKQFPFLQKLSSDLIGFAAGTRRKL